MRQLAGADGHHISVETPTQPQHTLKCMILDPRSAHEPVTFERLRAWAPAVLPHVPPFRWQLAPPPMGLGHPFWIDRPELDVDYHVRVTRVAAPGGRAELATVLGQLLGGELLDRSRPLWQLWLVEGLADSRVALVWKVHHSLADGIASVRMFSAVLQHGPEERPVVSETPPTTDPDPTRRRLITRTVRSFAPNVTHLERREVHPT